MSSDAVLDEYNSLFASQKERPSHHPEDASSDDQDGTTLAADTPQHSLSSSKSIRGSKPSRRSSDNDDDDEDIYDLSDAGSHSRKPSKYYLPRTYNSNANTGPKGVIADALAFEAQKRAGRSAQANAGYGRTREMVLPKSQRAVRSRDRQGRRASDDEAFGRIGANKENEEEDDDDDDDLDEDVLSWRMKRMAELKAHTRPPQRLGRQTGSGLTFAGLERVDEMGYLEAIERASRGSVVVVFIFDDAEGDEDAYYEEPSVQLSEGYGEHLCAVAQKYPHVRFVALHREVAEIDGVAVPAILAYRDGEQFVSMVPLRDEVPLTCNVVTNLDEALKAHDIV